jgi:hypothetical protein
LPATKSVEQVPNVGSDEQKPAAPPTQVNEANTPDQQSTAQSSDSSSSKDKDSKNNESSSKKKKKKKLGIF